MPDTLRDRIKYAWNAFNNRDPTAPKDWWKLGATSGTRPDRTRLHLGNERSIIASIYNRIAIDVSSVTINHVRLDENGRYIETIDSYLNECLTTSANIDQTGRMLIQDIVFSMFDEGCIAVVPVECDDSPIDNDSYAIYALRVGRITEWYPGHVRINLYNGRTGYKEDVTLPKDAVAIIENPLYAVMNEPSSTLNRLIRKLNMLDSVDEQSSSGKLDIIIQLPYTIKTPQRQAQAEERRKNVEMQLAGSKYGIAYIDATEHITQLNRPSENNLMAQVQYLTTLLYNQLGMTEGIFDGTADEKTVLNYNNKTVEPIVSTITGEMRRKFLTKTARSQGQSIWYFRDPFKLVPISELAEIADKFTRNEILSSNEFRAIVGYKPSKDPRADELRNANMGASKDQLPNVLPESTTQIENKEGENQNGSKV